MKYVLILALLFRLYLVPQVFHHDLICQASWGNYIHSNSPKDYYSNTVWDFSWPNHPPLTSLLYSYSYKIYLKTRLTIIRSSSYILKHNLSPSFLKLYFSTLKSYEIVVSPTQPYTYGYLISLKFWAILGDILIAILIFYIAKKYSRHPWIFPLIYLASPFSWYISSLWGQTDQLSFFFTLLAFLSLTKFTLLPIIFFFLSVSIKPTSVMFAPLFLYILYFKKTKIQSLIVPCLICLGLSFLIFSPFYKTNIIDFVLHTLIPKVVYRAEFRVSTNAYNFWHIFILNKAVEHNTKIFSLISYKNLGLLIYSLFVIYSMKIIKKIDTFNIVFSLFIISGASWLFLTNMLDRYFFTFIATGLILCIFRPKLFRYWIPLSIIYWLNLFKQWYYPNSFVILKNILEYKHGLIGGFLSLANVVLYFLMIK